jgi:asparagine synthase (glutamine-hydrolysing)
MSGICGIVDFSGGPADAETVSLMAEAAAHRGPDGIRCRVRGNVGFANLALNLTPESERETQPLRDTSADLVLTADARVDNRRELIDALTAKGLLREAHPTDAELILAAYRCWGVDCPAQLIGDFAFAIWDGVRRRLFAARDPMAMRSFYYRAEPRRFLFGTEIPQILAVPGTPRRIFEPQVAAYLAGSFGRLESTFYEGISELPPAHALLVDEAGHRTWRYWDIDPDLQIRYADEQQYAEHFRELFTEAVRCRIRSIKPVGILLSGGLDSGSIASTAGWLMQRGEGSCPAFRAYCFAFHDLPECDERHISDGIVRHYNLPKTDVPVVDPLADYPDHGPDPDEPSILPHQASVDRAMAIARSDGVGLLLSGFRGDLAMGMNIYDYAGLLFSGRWKVLLEELQKHSEGENISFRRAVKKYLFGPWRQVLWPPARAPRLRRAALGMFRKFRPAPSLFPPWVRPEFSTAYLDEIGWRETPSQHVKGFSRRERYRYLFSAQVMRAAVLSERKQARFGLGCADPWSDRRIASFAAAVPQRVLNTTGEEKRLTRLAMRGIMPEEARLAARKIYPGALYSRALRQSAHDTLLGLFTSSRASALGYFDDDALRTHYEIIRRGGKEHPCFWWTLTLEMWLRLYWSARTETPLREIVPA